MKTQENGKRSKDLLKIEFLVGGAFIYDIVWHISHERIREHFKAVFDDSKG